VPKIILRRDRTTPDEDPSSSQAGARARPGGAVLGNGGVGNPFATAGGGSSLQQNPNFWGDTDGGGALALPESDGATWTSPALGSVETAASTQPPPSPLSPSYAQAGGWQPNLQPNFQQNTAGSDDQGHRMLWARTGTGTTGGGGGAAALQAQQQQQERSPLWADASAAPWMPAGGAGPAGGGGGSGSNSGSGSAASSTATTPVANPAQRHYSLQQQNQQQQSQYPQHSQAPYQQQQQPNQAGMSTPAHSPARSGKKRGSAGSGSSPGSEQPTVDYTQPVSLEEAQAIAMGGGGGSPWASPHRQHPQQGPQQQQGPASPPQRNPPSWVGVGAGAGGSGGADPFLQHQQQQHRRQMSGGGGEHLDPRLYHQQQSAPYVLQPRSQGGDGDHHHYQQQQQQHPPRPPLHHPHSHQIQHPQQHPHHQQHPHPHPQDQRRPPLQHHVSSPASSAPPSPQRGPSSSYPSPQLKPHSHGTGDRPPQHQQHRESHHHPPTAASSSSGSRSPSEILKTLLRKKACLYEPTTSHAIATVTWLVGRNLTMSRGYFTRQSLQTGVHEVVDSKIAAGAITRTKVNRCMQIILNSCFHYIIPRVDGSEEDGTAFSVEFTKTAKLGDDAVLLESLPPPWTDLDVPMEIADQDEEEEVVAPTKSGRHGSSSGSAKGGGGGGYITSKRSVLLCFNENVRCAQDVFRCHNEFIRDAAHGSNLNLTAEEWRSFFSGGVSPTSPSFGPTPSGGKAPSTVSTGSSTPTSTGISVSPASLSPAGIRPVNEGDVDTAGIQPPALTLGSAWSQAPSTISLLPRMTKEGEGSTGDDEGEQHEHPAACRPAPLTGDVLGELTPVDLGKFRTTWCCKRYEHDPSICSFAHVEVNGGWLRRDPILFQYSAEMCPDIVSAAQVLGTTNVPAELKGCLFNRCPRGKNCDKAHSREEVQYHPDVYKKTLCPSVRKGQDQDHFHHHHGGGKSSKQQPCKLRDVCPLLHPPGSTQPKEHHHGHGHHHHRGKGSGPSPAKNAATATAASGGPPIPGAPMIYLQPAPPSDFDAYLQLPGLQEMFRRRCANLFHYYHKSGAGHKVGTYSIFGDNWGLLTKDEA